MSGSDLPAARVAGPAMDEARHAYVRSALMLQGYRLDDAAMQRVALQFDRIAEVAQGMLDVPVPLHAEPATLYRP